MPLCMLGVFRRLSSVTCDDGERNLGNDQGRTPRWNARGHWQVSPPQAIAGEERPACGGTRGSDAEWGMNDGPHVNHALILER
jgi:hypothetical protein